MEIKEYFKHTHNKKGVDRTLLIERLKLTPTERLIEHIKFMEFIESVQKQTTSKKHDQL